MNDTIKGDEDMPEPEANDDAVNTEFLSETATEEKKSEDKPQSDEKIDDTASKSPSDDGLKGTALLKSLLSTSTASLVPVVEKMITTTEVTDEKLNLKKILYQPDKEKNDVKETEISAQNGQQTSANDAPADEDDRRLVIDISDEEKDSNDRKNIEKSIKLQNMLGENENKISRRVRPTNLETGSLHVRQASRHQFRSQSEYQFLF
jgi:hypothetical protein